jgi:hypothetical protein
LLEWDYYDFGTKRVTFTDQVGDLCGVGCTGSADINQRINVLKFGINYRFGLGKAAPVVARY